jgi:hypothetical protein
MISTHPTDARYFPSRAAARANCRRGERVIRLGVYQWGSFGCYGPLRANGIPVGGSAHGAPPSICVWMVTAKS